MKERKEEEKRQVFGRGFLPLFKENGLAFAPPRAHFEEEGGAIAVDTNDAAAVLVAEGTVDCRRV